MSVRKIFEDEENSKIHFVILTGQYGNRMKGLGPYSMIELNGKTILERNINTIRNYYKNEL